MMTTTDDDDINHVVTPTAPTEEDLNFPSSNGPESVLILKKVLNPSTKDFTNNKFSNICESYRSKHPKSNIYARSSVTNNKTSAAAISGSVQICAICLEEYQAGEDIAWSKNPDCHHVYHKHCILRLLKTHDECPICRHSYYDGWLEDIELGGLSCRTTSEEDIDLHEFPNRAEI